MSLEMIIGLLILLVVAAVIISLFMNKIKEFTSMNSWQQDLEYRRFKSDCESFCKEGTEGQIAKYCSYKLNKNDLNGNKRVENLTSETSVLPMCEDAVYCFLVAKCEPEGGSIDAKACREILCKAWTEVYNGDLNSASDKVRSLVPGYGTCTLNDNENWWRIAKFGPNPPCGGSSQQPSVSLQCAKDSSNPTNMICVWICPSTVSASNLGTLAVGGTVQSIAITNLIGSTSFSNLNAGTSYAVTLTCDKSNSVYSTTQTVQM